MSAARTMPSPATSSARQTVRARAGARWPSAGAGAMGAVASPAHLPPHLHLPFAPLGYGRRLAAPARMAPLRATPADDTADFRQKLMQSAGGEGEDEGEGDGGEVEGGTMTGPELREIIMARWGRAYDLRICQKRDRFNKLRLYVQVMWKFLGQKTFPLTEEQYDAQLDAVASLITEWGQADKLTKQISECKKSPVLDTTGATAVMILLDVEASSKSFGL